MMANAGGAWAIRPYHTTGDGDQLFAVSTGQLPADVPVSVTGALAPRSWRGDRARRAGGEVRRGLARRGGSEIARGRYFSPNSRARRSLIRSRNRAASSNFESLGRLPHLLLESADLLVQVLDGAVALLRSLRHFRHSHVVRFVDAGEQLADVLADALRRDAVLLVVAPWIARRRLVSSMAVFIESVTLSA